MPSPWHPTRPSLRRPPFTTRLTLHDLAPPATLRSPQRSKRLYGYAYPFLDAETRVQKACIPAGCTVRKASASPSSHHRPSRQIRVDFNSPLSASLRFCVAYLQCSTRSCPLTWTRYVSFSCQALILVVFFSKERHVSYHKDVLAKELSNGTRWVIDMASASHIHRSWL